MTADSTMQREPNRPKDERIRVLWVIKVLGPGGAEQLLLNAARAHDRSSFDFHCAYIIEDDRTFVEDLVSAGVCCHHLVSRHRRWKWPIRLTRLIISGKFDVIHTHSPLMSPISRLAHRMMKRRSRPAGITTVHSSWQYYHPFTRIATALTAGMDDKIFAVSSESLQSIRGPAKPRSELLTHGVETVAIKALRQERDNVRKELGIDQTEMVIGTVANFRELKGYPHLLAACQLLVRDEVPFRLVAVGHGPLESAMWNLAKDLNIDSRIMFLGRRRDAVRIMAACDVFTLSSLREGFPVAIMEALALGLPIVATNVGGIGEQLGAHDAFALVPPQDPEALAAALFKVCTDEALRKHMAAGSAEFAPKFDIRHAVTVLEATYRQYAPRR